MSINWSDLHNQMYLKAREKRQPISVSFEITSRCNFQCKMCYVRKLPNDEQAKARELSADQWLGLAEEARSEGMLFLTLTGGEILLRKDFRYIYEQLSKMGFLIQFLSNASLMTPDFVQWLSKIPPLKMHITLYGMSPETYQNVCGQAYAFERTLKAIDLLVDSGMNMEVRTTIIKDNLHDFEKMFNYTRSKNLRLGLVNYVSPQRSGVDSDPLGTRLSPAELMELEELSRRLDEVWVNEIKERKPVLSDPLASELLDNNESLVKQDENDAFRCMAGKAAAWILSDGTMNPCGVLDKPVAYPLKDGFKAAWEVIKNGCDAIKPCQECRSCEYISVCDTCPGRLKSESGYPDKPGLYLCESAQMRWNKGKKLGELSVLSS